MVTATLRDGKAIRNVWSGRRWLWLLVVVIMAGAGLFAYERYQSASAATATTTTTATIARGDLASTVTATGNIEPATEADLNFSSSGIVKEVLVKQGDVVQAGQALVRLDTADLEAQVTTAQASLDSAKLKLAQAKEGASDTDLATAQAKVDSAQAALDALYAGPTQAELTDAQSKVASAQATLAKARQGTATAAEIASAQAAITSAQANLDSVKAGATATDIANAQQKVEQAKNALWAAQSSRDSTCGRTKDPDNDSSCQNARAQVNQQEAAVQIAQNDLAALQAGPTDAAVAAAEQTEKAAEASLAKLTNVDPNDVAVAQQNVTQAQAALDKLKEGPTDAEVTQAKAAVTEAQAALDALKKGPDTLTVQVAETAVTQAEAALKQAQIKLEQATLTAPTAGVVTEVNAVAGTTASASSNPIHLADLNDMQIQAQVSELDRAKLKVGQTVNIALEALSDKTLAGEVTAISPVGTSTSGVVNYTVTVKVTETDPSVAAGMTATLNIVTDSRQGVLTVPTKAIQTVNQQKVVTVLRNGESVQVPVTAGLTDGSKTEISSANLKEGDVVIVSGAGGSSSSSSSTTKSNQGGMGIPGVGGGPPAGGM
ncbi:MAG: efflux RND transporter periplasmic adaptor subunit [Anaerolineae bacterium]